VGAMDKLRAMDEPLKAQRAAVAAPSPLERTRPAPPETRGRRTRAALLQAGREVFEQQGFKNARIHDIAARAGTSHGTFYTYFSSKENFFHDVVHQVTGEMMAASRASQEAGADPLKRIELTNRCYLRAYARNARILAVIEEMSTYDDHFRRLRLGMRDMWLQRNERGIRRLQQIGLADPHLDAALAASALGGMVEHFGHVWFVLGQPYDEECAVETLTRLWAQALGMQVPAVKKSLPLSPRRCPGPLAADGGRSMPARRGRRAQPRFRPFLADRGAAYPR